ncbi:MAG: methyltransferase domain-containing protein [Candidatus Lokiarchaeota archaeon]|nr:methyltransferase domain-containing protein [Candidatus Lokiarchaeota archaeon]
MYLVIKEISPSRSIAKNLIKDGYVSVNGNICTKYSYTVKSTDKIKIQTTFQNKTRGFWKLLLIEKEFSFIRKEMKVLDLGSSKGGFLEYCALKCKKVVGIEISKDFSDKLKLLKEKYNNIEIINENIFNFNTDFFKKEYFNCILNDLTLDPFISFSALLKVLPFLKKKGFILFSVKLGDYSIEELKEKLEQQFLYNNLVILKELNIKENNKEIHYILEKNEIVDSP